MSDLSKSESLINRFDIPFKHVTWGMYFKLANKLDPDSTVIGNNWRMLAEKLGYSTLDILVFESQQTSHGRNTIKVLQDYKQKQGSTVNKVYKALQEIDRRDALEELKAGLPDIEKSYWKELRERHQHQEMDETKYTCPSCTDMPVSRESFLSYPSAQQNHMMMPSSRFGPYHGLHGTFNGGKNLQRHKSVDTSVVGSRLPGYNELRGSDYKRQCSVPLTDGMLAVGHNGHSCVGGNSMEPMDHMPSVRDEPVPPALAFMRGMARFNTRPMCPSVLETANLDQTFRHPCGHNLPSEKSLKLNIPPPSVMYNWQKHGDFVSPSPTPTSTPSTPLGHLQLLANETKFQPEDGYRDLMKMKHDEELIREKSYPDKKPFPAHISGTRECAMSFNSVDTSPVRADHCQQNSSPFSLQSFPSTYSSTQPLMKTVTLSSNMKAVEYRKAYRHIKVFVTYAADNKEHIRRVLNLCKCLEKNGFMCCVDIFHRKLPAEEREDWYHKKFEEADFILAVMSQKYKREADSCELEHDAEDSESSDSNNEHNEFPYQLHTKHIYRLMYSEYLQNGGSMGSTRFVPLLFKDVSRDIIPQWMLETCSKLVYHWPDEFKDLLWMLTKPDRHVPEHTPKQKQCLQNLECLDTGDN